jgi:niacin transporter
MKHWATQKITAAALLTAIGIAVPLFSPLRVVLEPASFTLASHVAIFIAMMISPGIAAAVTAGTTLGFFISFPLVIALRAASHIVFALAGGIYLSVRPDILDRAAGARVFSFAIAVLHAACEVVVVGGFYFWGGMGESYYQRGFIHSVLLLVGLGSIVHSMIDFDIALMIYKVLRKQRGFAKTAAK